MIYLFVFEFGFFWLLGEERGGGGGLEFLGACSTVVAALLREFL